MSDTGPKSERPPQSAAQPAATRSQPGFVTMPTDLRAFQRPDPNAGSLAEAEVVDAASKLREAGRGPDLLFENLREGPPRAPSPDDNRAEHVIIQMPGAPSAPGESPWAKEAAPAGIDKQVLPSATVRSSQPPPSVTDDPPTQPSVRSGHAEAARTKIGVWLGLCAAAAVIVVILLRGSDRDGPDAGTSGGPAATTSEVEAMGTLVAPTVAPTSTGAATITDTTSAAPSVSAVPSGTPHAPAASGGTRPIPRATEDPYPDAGALPKPPASADPSAASSTTSAPTAPVTAAPGVSSAPSSKPAATGAPSFWFPPKKAP